LQKNIQIVILLVLIIGVRVRIIQ